MKKSTPPQQLMQPSFNESPTLPGSQIAFSPSQFARVFGKSPTWGYRRVWEGTVKVLRYSGTMMIPRSEVERLLADVAPYEDKRGPGGSTRPGKHTPKPAKEIHAPSSSDPATAKET